MFVGQNVSMQFDDYNDH